MENQVAQQSEQIRLLEQKMKMIDELTHNQVYQDPVRKIQEEFLA